jgi:uncharacterized protein (TIGR02145 family)
MATVPYSEMKDDDMLSFVTTILQEGFPMSAKRIAYAAALGIFGSVLLIVGVSCNNDTIIGGINKSGTVMDVDGNVYQTVKIGNQEWTTENLRTTKYNDGSPISNITSKITWDSCTYTLTEAYCYYNNTTNSDSIKKFGALYNWYAVNTGKLAPAGWHVSTDEEWDTLQNYLIANGYNWDGTTTENKIAKSLAAKTDWKSSSDDAIGNGAIGNDLTKNNRSGFSALPGGTRDPENDFNGQMGNGFWWCATNGGATCTWSRSLSVDYEDLLKPFSDKYCGFSLRLVRDVN